MPRLARWDDSFEFEDVPELVAVFLGSPDNELWPADVEKNDPVEPVAELSEEDLTELVEEVRALVKQARRSPSTSGLGQH